MARITLGPGVQFLDLAVPGPSLLLVDTGTLTVTMQGETDESEYIDELEGFVQRAAVNGTPVSATGSVEVASFGTFRITLHAGDRVLIPADWPHAMRNDTGAPISVLAVAVTPPEPETGGPLWPPAGAWPPELPNGVTVQSMDAGYRASTALPQATSAEILLERVDLQPGASLDVEPGSPRLLTIVDGSLSLTCDAACPVHQASSNATPTALANPVATPVERKGGKVTLAPGESALIPIDVHATVSAGPSGSQSVSFLAVSVAPSNEIPARQHEH
jgi:quercetin dioxygenase-like cupin family protein